MKSLSKAIVMMLFLVTSAYAGMVVCPVNQFHYIPGTGTINGWTPVTIDAPAGTYKLYSANAHVKANIVGACIYQLQTSAGAVSSNTLAIVSSQILKASGDNWSVKPNDPAMEQCLEHGSKDTCKFEVIS